MKFHPTLIEKLLKTYEIYSGWQEEIKLKKALAELNISIYVQQDGTEVLVDTEELARQIKNIQAERK